MTQAAEHLQVTECRQFDGSSWHNVQLPRGAPLAGAILCTVTYTDILSVAEADLLIPTPYRIPGTIAYRINPSSCKVLAQPVVPDVKKGSRRWKTLSAETHAEVARQLDAAETQKEQLEEASAVLFSLHQNP